MPTTPSFQTEISAYRQELLAQQQSTDQRFEKLRKLYHRFISDSEALALMKYGTSLIAADNQYENLKVACRNEHQELKRLQKVIDDRTLMVEQQLYNGLPSDLQEMEKVIAEQESILDHQQQLNQREENLLEKMRKIDIDHGRNLALIEQQNSTSKSPLQTDLKNFVEETEKEERRIIRNTKYLAILPVLLIPIALDFLAQKWGLQKIGESHYIFSHSVFFVVFLIMEIAFSTKIKKDIAAYQAKKAANRLFLTFDTQWTAVQTERQNLENKYGLSLAQINGYLDGQPEKES